MKKSITTIAALVLATTALVACKDGGSADAAKATAAKASGPAVAASTVAKYDPNLKPENIVWDSPEKKKMFEEMQARHAASAASGATTSASALTSAKMATPGQADAPASASSK